MRRKFGDKVDSEGFPFAPTQDGDAVTKDRMCDCIEDVAAAAGLETRDAEGRCLFIGQAFRIGGCRHQARHMVQVPSIMAMARWDSHIVLRYLKEASLATITAEYMRGARAFKGQSAEYDTANTAN